MKNMFIKRVLAIVLCGGIAQQTAVSPLGDMTAEIIAGAGGAAVGTGVGLACHYWLKQKPIVSIIAGLASGGLSWWGLRYFLLKLTPKGQLAGFLAIVADANATYEDCASYSRHLSANHDQLLKHVNLWYGGTSWALVTGRNAIANRNSRLSSAALAITQLQRELTRYQAWSEPNYEQKAQASRLGQEIQALLEKIRPIQPVYITALDAIVSHPYYLAQCEMYEKHMEAERQREHEAQLAREKMAAKSSMEQQKIWELQKDRQLKEKMANQLSSRPGTQGRINVNI